MALAGEAIYSILHVDRLKELAARQTPADLRATQRWVTAAKHFAAAREQGFDFPILFADAAFDCSRLMYWGKVTRLRISDSSTEYTVAEVRPIRGRKTQELVLLSTGKRIAEGFLRPYAVVRTPDFLQERALRASEPTLFSFGYWGCGGATAALVRSVAAAEERRGYEPPLWVDVRIRRNVRAVGFRGDALERLLGNSHRWMPDLGNLGVLDNGPTRLKDPEAAHTLIDLAIAQPRRRVIFFCACEQPANCHRRTVAQAVKEAAQNRGIALTVVEWPGGTPVEVNLDVPQPVVQAVATGTRKTIPIGASRLPELTALPWGSGAILESPTGAYTAVVGPARFSAAGAHLPVLPQEFTTERHLEKLGYAPIEVRETSRSLGARPSRREA